MPQHDPDRLLPQACKMLLLQQDTAAAHSGGMGVAAAHAHTLAMYSGLPPSRMSVPRPAMLVEMVTEPFRPLCATISASLCTFSGFAFSSSYLMPAGAHRMPRGAARLR